MTINEATLDVAGFELFVKIIKPNNPSKETTVFLHDSLGCVALWRDFPEKYLKLTGHNVVIYDRRGYGNSTPYQDEKRKADYMEIEADVLSDLLEKLEVGPCTLFGHSDGATISLIAAAKYPHLIKQLIIEGPHIYVEDITKAGIRSASDLYINTDLKQRLEKYHGDRTDELVNAWINTWLSDFFQDWNIAEQLTDITCPIIAFQGEKDEFGTSRQVWDIRKLVTGACVVHLIPEIGHTPHKECPEVVLNYLREYFG